MTCNKTKDKFADYLTGDIDGETRRDIQAHIAECASCREELESLTLIWAKLGVLPEERPGPTLRDRFYGMLEDYRAALDTAEGNRCAVPVGMDRPGQRSERSRQVIRFRNRFSFRRPGFAASFSVLLLLFGIGVGWFLAGGRMDSGRLTLLSAELQTMRRQVALSLLDRPSASDRLLGIGYSTQIDKPDAGMLDALIDAIDNDPNPNIRLAAVEALYLFRNMPGVRESLTRSLTVQGYPLVQIAIIDFLVDIREERAADALKRLIEDDAWVDPEVRKRAELGLRQII